MPKKAKALGAREVSRLDGRGLHAVGEVGGLCLRVAPSGARGWILRIRIGGRQRDIGLGGYPDVTLARAREKARAMRDKVAEGVDVLAEREAARRALIAARVRRMTFAQAARAKWSAIAPGFRNAKHRREWLSSLENYAYPVLGDMDVADIELPHVLAVLEPIWRTRTETATRVRQRIEAVLAWATTTKHRTGANPAAWKHNLSEVLPAPGKIAVEGHHPALSWQDIPGFMARLHKRRGAAARALEVAILTAARSGEVRGMEWSELSPDFTTWTIPKERMKAKRPHVVPLSPAAQALVKAQPHHLGSEFVFAAPRDGKLSDMTLSAVCRRMKVAAVPHGFRSSFKDWCRNCTAYADEVSELCLAHVSTDATRAAYARDGLLPQRARLLAEWARYCAEGMPNDATVTPIRARGAQ